MGASFVRDLGPAVILWNGSIVGKTYGGVKLKIDDSVADIHEDEQGVIAVDAVFTGRKVADIEVPLTRFTIAELDTLFHGAVGSPLVFSNVVGENMYPLSKELVFKPIINGVVSVTSTEWVTVYKTYPVAKAEIGYDNAGQRVFKFAFQVFPNADSGHIGELGEFGG